MLPSKLNLLLPLMALLFALAAPFAQAEEAAVSRCGSERPKLILEGLTRIDEAGEAQLEARLKALSKHESWTQNDWETYTLSLADNPRANELSAQRDALVAQVFGILARPAPACAELDRLEAEIFAAEQQQWDESIERVEQRLRKARVPGYF